MPSVSHSMLELAKLIRADMQKLDQRLERATRRAAQRTAQHLAANARRELPVAFGTLRDSIHAEGSRVVADAPHAWAIEHGSAPHWPPIEPLVRWVKLRGFQSLVGPKRLERLPGTTTAEHASRIGARIDELAERGPRGRALVVNIDVPRQIAWAIAYSISKHGTKPTFFMQKQIPRALEFLREETEAALREG